MSPGFGAFCPNRCSMLCMLAHCAVTARTLVLVWSQQRLSSNFARQLLKLLLCTLQSLMERALAGQFDRSLKFGHSSGIWQVNDKGWEDDEDHIDFDVSDAPQPIILLIMRRHAKVCSRGLWPVQFVVCFP